MRIPTLEEALENERRMAEGYYESARALGKTLLGPEEEEEEPEA